MALRHVLIPGRLLAAAAAAAALSAALGGCASSEVGAPGAGSSVAGTLATAVATTAAATTPAPVATTPPPPPPPQMTTPPALTWCKTSQVKVSASNSNGAAGTQVERFLITNTSSVTCTVQSYPGISPYGPMKQGGSTVQANLTIKVDPIASTFGDLGGPGGLVTLHPGGSSAFFLSWSDVVTGNSACPTANGFAFHTPQETGWSDQAQVSFDFGAMCGTEMNVSQMFPPSVTS